MFSQILRYAQRAGFVVPFLKGGKQTEGVAYEGATVLQAHTGYYSEPVATLDFASLYPSIMMAHNLCYSTLVPPAELARLQAAGQLKDEDYAKAPGTGVHLHVAPSPGQQLQCETSSQRCASCWSRRSCRSAPTAAW